MSKIINTINQDVIIESDKLSRLQLIAKALKLGYLPANFHFIQSISDVSIIEFLCIKGLRLFYAKRKLI